MSAEKLKLLYFAKARITSYSTNSLQTMRMCDAFVKLGLQVELVVPPHWVGEQKFRSQNPISYYNVKSKFKITRLAMPDLMALMRYFSAERLHSILKRIHWVLSSLMVFIYAFFKRADVLFTRDPVAAFFMSFFGPVVYECHGQIESRMFRFFERKCCNRCSLTVAISQNIKNYLMEKGVPEKQVHVLHDGVDIEIYDVTSTQGILDTLNIDKNEKLVVYTGHLYPYKGIYDLAKVAKVINGIVVFVGGRKEDVAVLKDYVSKHSINNVIITGHVKPALVPLYQKAADVLVLPNSGKDIRNTFTSPLKLFEYMASRKPIVASRLPSITEILNEGNAILVEADTPRKLAEGINKALTNEQLSKRIADQAYQDVRLNTWENRAAKICALLNSRRINASSVRHKPSYSRGLDRKTV